MMHRTRKIAIVGAGSVGATIAYACLIRGVGERIVLFDTNRPKVEAQALDLVHGLQFVPPATVEGSDDVAVCADADVVIITAGARQKPGQTRMELAEANTAICKRLVPELIRLAPNATILVVTNPVDVLTHVTLKVSGLPAHRVLGSGTVLDSSRFRYLIARRCTVAVQNVHAVIAGEHGDSEVPLWSSATIGNIPLHEWAVAGHGKLSVHERNEIFQRVKSAAEQIIDGKGATNYAIGLATARILEAILNDENRVMPVSAMLNDFRGINNVCISVPRIVGCNGVGAALPIPMNDEEVVQLRESAEKVREALKAIGF